MAKFDSTKFISLANLQAYNTLIQKFVTDRDGDLNALNTTAKNNLVAAINEALAAAGGAGSDIGDLEELIGSLPADATSETVVDYILEAIGNEIAKLDATKEQAAGADGLALKIVETDGKITSIEGSIAANTYDAYGSAAAVDGKLTTLSNTVGKATEGDTAGTGLTKRIEDLETAIGEGGSVSTQITTEINKLDKADTAVANQFVTAVSEDNGIITVSRAALVAADIPELAQSKITGLTDALAGKQDELVFMNDNYDAATNKVATASDVSAAVAGLSGAMHFKGAVDAVPTDKTGYESGDVILVGNKEYVYDGTNFIELGDETIYAVAGNIKNADIAADAAIAQSKIAGLTDALAGKATTGSVEALEASVNTEGTGLLDRMTAVEGKLADGGEIKTAITSAVQALDYNTAADGDYVASITETDGVIAPVYGTFNFDEAGAAAAVLGTDADAAGTATVYGALASAAAAQADVNSIAFATQKEIEDMFPTAVGE